MRNASASVEYAGNNDTVRINLIDTPGHSDFAGEADRAFSVLDGAILVVSAVEGVQSHTENLRRAFTELKIPHIIFVNKIDRAGSSFERVLSELRELGGDFAALNRPASEGDRSCSVNESSAEELTEILADFDDEIAESYLSGEIPGREELYSALGALVSDCRLTPVMCGAAAMGIGVDELLGAAELLPSADTSGEAVSAVVYRIEHDRDMGKVAHVRMYGGELRSRDDLSICGVTRWDSQSRERIKLETVGKISQIRRSMGGKYTDTGFVGAGDIAALCGEPNLRIGDIIGEVTPRAERIAGLAHPYLTVCARPRTEAELPALTTALRELSDEEPLMNFRWEKTEREAHIDLTGSIQLEIIAALLLERYGLNVDFTPPSVIYKETPTRAGDGFEAYTMPKPCWAIVRFHLEPTPRGSGVVYDGGNIPHNQLFYKYQSHIRTSFFDSLAQGMYGWEVTDFKCTLTGGEHHTIHTHPLDFFVATPMALMDGLRSCGTTLLEPLLKVKIRAPEECLGKVIGDITNMRGEFDTPVVTGGGFALECLLPVSTSLDYPVRLASLSGGRGIFAPVFYGYRECPIELGATTPRRGINPLDRSKWILWARGAMTESLM